jgi:hypothetical protein
MEASNQRTFSRAKLSEALMLRAELGLAWSLSNLGDAQANRYWMTLKRVNRMGMEDALNGRVSVVFSRADEREEVRQAYLSGHQEQTSRLALMGVRPYNEWLWIKTCERLSSEAAIGCGQSDVVWSRNLSRSIQPYLSLMTGVERAEAQGIATRQGYLSPQELQTLDDELEVEGLCRHGLDANTCPCGCFEGD